MSKKKWENSETIFNLLKEKNVKLEFYTEQNISFKNEGEMLFPIKIAQKIVHPQTYIIRHIKESLLDQNK